MLGTSQKLRDELSALEHFLKGCLRILVNIYSVSSETLSAYSQLKAVLNLEEVYSLGEYLGFLQTLTKLPVVTGCLIPSV